MSGVGAGLTEMQSALMDDGQLQLLHLMLNDLKMKVEYVTSYQFALIYSCGPYKNLELENCKAGILPPACGRGSMLKLSE